MNDSRNILVLTNDAGLGHRQAALATVAALEQRYGALCRPLLVNPLDEPGVPAALRNSQSDFNRVVRFAPAAEALAGGRRTLTHRAPYARPECRPATSGARHRRRRPSGE